MHCITLHACVHHDGWSLAFEGTRLLGKLAIPVCRNVPRYSCIVFAQHPQSQLVVYTVIAFEQTLITVSEIECTCVQS